MTKQLLLAGAAAMLASTASAVSQIPADGTIENYAIIATDMSGLHGGVQGRTGERTLSQKNGFEGSIVLPFSLNHSGVCGTPTSPLPLQ